MANTKSTKKNIRVTERRTLINKARKSRVRTFLRKVFDEIRSGNEESARKALVGFESEVMKAVSKGVYKKNTAARKIRRVANHIRKMKETK